MKKCKIIVEKLTYNKELVEKYFSNELEDYEYPTKLIDDALKSVPVIDEE